jgi:outer membrane protein
MTRRGRAGLGASIVIATLLGPGAASPDEPTEIPVIPVRASEVWFRDTWVARVNGGYATEKTLGEISAGGVRVEDDEPGLIGVDVGRPIVEDFRDWPIDFEWRIGLDRYFERGAQSDFWGHTLYLKAYWKAFPWGRWLRTRIGLGEGISYTWHIPQVERDEARRHDRNTSRLLNYLDVSVDLNFGDLVRVKRLQRCWLGFLIDHRSGAFGLIDIFGSVNGGSNYNTAYLECTF